VVISEILPMVELIILIEPTASWVRDLQRADAVDRIRFRRQFRHVADQLREAAILATVAAKER
jgi:nicotinamide riboside kinase